MSIHSRAVATTERSLSDFYNFQCQVEFII